MAAIPTTGPEFLAHPAAPAMFRRALCYRQASLGGYVAMNDAELVESRGVEPLYTVADSANIHAHRQPPDAKAVLEWAGSHCRTT